MDISGGGGVFVGITGRRSVLQKKRLKNPRKGTDLGVCKTAVITENIMQQGCGIFITVICNFD